MTGHSLMNEIARARQADVIRATKHSHLVRQAEIDAMENGKDELNVAVRRQPSTWLFGLRRRITAAI